MATETIKIRSTKSKTKWVCNSCGYESLGFLGRCTECGSWGSFEEKLSEKNPGASAPKNSLFVDSESKVQKLSDIPDSEITRFKTGSEEFDRVLGGGIVPGSLTLIGGHPGVGKSTLLLQIASNFAAKALYISAEESSEQLKIRASRMEFKSSKNTEEILVYTENNLEKIIKEVKEHKPKLLIIDSIQAIYQPNIDSIPGSPTQIRETCSNLMRLAKSSNIPIFLVGHINKDGDIAGPKILEHMVDTVLQFEGDQDRNFRIIRSIKNRFGSTDEIGLFDMSSSGLRDVLNPSEIFLKERSGGVIVATREGQRSLLLELQSLVLNSEYHNPRRLANGIELTRLHQILAVLEKKLNITLSKADVYINVIGGLSIKEPAADLAVALSIYLSASGFSEPEKLTKNLVVLGEIGLNGEIRAVNNVESRLKEAEKLGFKKAIIPGANARNLKNKIALEIHAVNNINDVVKSPLL